MQKKVLAAVIGGLLTAPAVFADSANVTISGRVAVGIEAFKLSAGNAAAPRNYATEQRVSDQSSSLVFSGSEDLGGGMKAWFQIDERFAPDLGTLSATGNTQAGLGGGWGKVALGRQDVHYNEVSRLDATRAGSLQTILSDGPFSQVNGSVIANGTRTPNIIYWDSADLSGFTARVGYSTSWQGNEIAGASAVGTTVRKGPATTAAVRYASGPILAGASFWTANNQAAGAPPSNAGDQKSNRAWFGWNMAGLKAGAAYDSSQLRQVNQGSFVKRNAWLIPVDYSFGAEAVYFTYAKMGKLSGAAVTDNTDATAVMIGYDHALSKRTYVGAYYTQVKNKANATYAPFALAASGANGGVGPAAGETATQLYFGFTHLF